jgi:hypothetical protein
MNQPDPEDRDRDGGYGELDRMIDDLGEGTESDEDWAEELAEL